MPAILNASSSSQPRGGAIHDRGFEIDHLITRIDPAADGLLDAVDDRRMYSLGMDPPRISLVISTPLPFSLGSIVMQAWPYGRGRRIGG